MIFAQILWKILPSSAPQSFQNNIFYEESVPSWWGAGKIWQGDRWGGGGQNLCGRHRGYEIGDENFVGVGHWQGDKQ